MELPNQLELQTLFSGFLFEAGLSTVSVKNYLSDLRNFLSYCASISSPENPPTVQEIFQSISKYVSLYTDEQRRSFTPQNTINRRLASIRRFSTFLNAKFGLQNDQNTTSRSSITPSDSQKTEDSDILPTISKILERFRVYLINEKRTHSTIKNYISDLNHFFAWSAKQTPFIDQKLENLLSESQLNVYVTYLRLNHTSTSVINRRQSSIKKFTKYCFLQNFIPDNPFESKPEVPKLAPLSWLERLKSKPNNSHKPSRNRFVRLYQKYNSLPFTPYLHLAILVLATSAMVIFGYNQIIKQAAPSAAALPTVPRRQLSFQGRLTDSSGTPIVTAVNVVFKLWNASTAGTQLYTSNTCSITPDSNGIFNTLIGNGTCGQEIASTVFTENRDVFLEITVGSETLTPRQQIATVGYALNSETLQGYPASATATINTIPLVDQNGDINIAASSPTINSTSGTFTVTGQALTLSTAANSGGDIILQPDALGGGNVQVLGSTTSTDTFRIENANLTSGSLISGYIGNNTATGNLLSLTSGSTETDRFLVGANGRTIINTNGGTDSIFSASSSGTTRFTIASNGDLLATGVLSGLTGLTVSSGTVSLPAGQINNTEISELDWTKLQNYPTACPAGQAVQAVGDTLTCVDISAASGNLWQRTSGSLAPLYTSDSLNLGSTATSSALVHLAGTSGENSFINTGNFGIGLTNPSYKLDVVGDINLTGALRDNGSAGTNGQVLTSTGTGIAWVNPSVITGVNQGWTWNTGVLYPTSITDAVNLGNAATASATVHLAGTTGDNSFINTGNFGIGTTNPAYTLDVVGDINLTGALRDNGSAGTNGQILSSTGTGIAWINAPTAGGDSLWQENGSVLSPVNILDAVNLGSTATNSATVHLAGTAGDNSFINTGNFGIGLTNPSYKLDVVGDINLTGALRDNGSAGTNGQVLTSTGTGIAWVNPSVITGVNQGWTWNTGVLYPTSITDAVNLGNAATASATVHLAGTAGDNSFINTGNFGIGTTTPGSKLTVNGTLTSSGGAINLNASSNFATNINTGTSTGAVTIGGGAATQTVAINSADWDISTTGAITNSDSYNGLIVTANTGVITTGTWNASLIPLAYGGTNKNMTAVNGGVVWTDADSMEVTLAGTAGQILQSNGAAAPSWIDTSSIAGVNQGWTWNTGVLYPTSITDAVNLGNAATASATVHLAGTAGDNSFINTGNFGIGLTNPTYDLDVVGDINLTGALRDNGSAGTNGQILLSTGTGIQWVDQSTIAVAQLWQYNGGVLSPIDINAAINLGSTATNSAYVHLAGTSGDNSFINTGRFGIGTTNPSYTLEVHTPNGTQSDINISTNTPLGSANVTQLSFTSDLGGTPVTASIGQFNTRDLRLSGSGNIVNPTMILTYAGNVGIGLTNPTYDLDVVGDINLTGQIKLGNFTTAGLPTSIGTGSLIYNTTQNVPQFYNGTAWKSVNYFDRTSDGILYPTNWYDSINLFASTNNGATSSAKIRLSGDVANNTFFVNPVAIGFTTAMESTAILQTSGHVLPLNTAANNNLGKIGYSWYNLFLTSGIVDNASGTQVISTELRRLTGANWNVTGNLGIGSTTTPTQALEVTGNATISGVLNTGGSVYVGGDELNVKNGTGKINAGTVDPPYTINGQKYATYMASMIGVKEEVVGNITTTKNDHIPGLGYRALIDLDQQPVGSDLWLFSKTTNIQSHINDLSVLLTPEGKGKAWYEIDSENKILAIYSSNPTSVTYRLTAPRFDSARWTNTRGNSIVGFVINDYNNYSNTTSIFDNPATDPELIAKLDGTYSLIVNGEEVNEVSSLAEGIIANFKAGLAVITDLVAENLTVRTKLVSPLADIDQLKVIDATISGTLYADNIQGQTVDTLNQEINLLNERYSTASAILTDLQAKYGTYGELLGSISEATVSADPLALSPLATSSAIIPSDLVLNSLNVHTLITNDVMANGSLFAQYISAYDTDLFIQPDGDKPVHLVANIMNIYPDGKILINGDLLINGSLIAQNIDTQTATVSGTLAVGTSTIATDSANFNQLVTAGLIIATDHNSASPSGSTQTFSNATIGTAVIEQGANEIFINNTHVTDSTLIYVTPTSITNGSVLYVKNKQSGSGFTVAISGGTKPSTVSFNYWLVETK